MVVTMEISTLNSHGFGYIFKYLGIVGYVLVCLFLLVIPQLQFAKAKDKEKYYNGAVQEEA